MFDLLDRQESLTRNQKRMMGASTAGNVLDEESGRAPLQLTDDSVPSGSI